MTWAGDSLTVREATTQVVLKGYTRAAQSINLTSEVGGKVASVNYEVGQQVRGELPFVRIDTTFVALSIESARARLDVLKASVKRSDSRVKYLTKENNRLKRLRKTGRISEAKYDASEQQLVQAELELSAVNSELATVEVVLKELKEKLARHHISPPAGWLITHRAVEPGEVVASGSMVGKAGDFSSLSVPLSVSLKELEAIVPNAESLDGILEGREVKVRLIWQNPGFDERTRKTAVELGITNCAGLDKRGGLLFELPLNVRAEGLLIPRSAVSWRYDNPRVTKKPTGQIVSLIVIDEGAEYLVVVRDGLLRPGDELYKVGQIPKAKTKTLSTK